MAVCSEHHKELTNGVGKCSKPMWDGYGMPNGFCDEPAYGEQTEEGKRRYNRYVPYLACSRHGGPKVIKCSIKKSRDSNNYHSNYTVWYYESNLGDIVFDHEQKECRVRFYGWGTGIISADLEEIIGKIRTLEGELREQIYL